MLQSIFLCTGFLSAISIFLPFGHIIPIISTVSSALAWYKIRSLSQAKSVMESVQKLKDENKLLTANITDLHNTVMYLENVNSNLHITNENLVVTEQNLKSDVKDLRSILSIIDTRNKTSEQIQEEMLILVHNLKYQNDRHNSINKTHAFLIADKNHDGKISGSEMNLLENIFSTDEISNLDKNSDKIITKEEFFGKRYYTE
jgi:Ca2+-binding EF-hand superfamily protein